MTITKDKFAAINYTLKDVNGVLLDSSVGLEPLGYVHGRGYLIPGLEAQLEGKAKGDKFSGWHPHGPSLRFFPHWAHRPLQSGAHKKRISSVRANVCRTTYIISIISVLVL